MADSEKQEFWKVFFKEVWPPAWRSYGWAMSWMLALAGWTLRNYVVVNELLGAILSAIGAALVGGACFGTVIWFVHFVTSRLPRQVLKGLSSKISVAQKSLRYLNGPLRDVEPLDRSAIRELTHELDREGIPYPDPSADVQVWSTYLGRLHGEARAGSVWGAREVLPEMEGKIPPRSYQKFRNP